MRRFLLAFAALALGAWAAGCYDHLHPPQTPDDPTAVPEGPPLFVGGRQADGGADR